MTFYWKTRKYFLDHIEDLMPNDSLVGSTISTKSQNNVSCNGKMCSSSVLSHDTKISKISGIANPHDFYPKNFKNVFQFKPDFERCSNNAKKEFDESQNFIGEEFYREPQKPSTFIKMVKKITRTMSPANDERRQVLIS
jgi:hypothetical protein